MIKKGKIPLEIKKMMDLRIKMNIILKQKV